ncbi:A/G-specific adenine glycosylase [Salinibacterium sp. NSLL150]|uniref:A/G-specific adenine glycosylase n=1 Tax=Salinibacterium sp. NSLL35 TaxID=2792044 RepID=UPI0018CE423A|nr:A/G-specific adenine glycosylase [Salinibacterium sp. NSLL35]MBH0102897.1 A/G-specific adenine glycosylase [Salinibacterium sp. NSLL150]MBH0105657.1 A/G-specific adenine glycosylase [Salinibacterium sp. NSLL16]MBH0108417.1 A/G-specific adenine glycosylase [Salinibacterium sp. NSLL17]
MTAETTTADRAELARLIGDWFVEYGRDLPWRHDGFGAWGILVSEIMLQQTPVVRVIPRLEQWLERWPSPAALAASAPGDAVRAWERLGYPRRALNLHAAATAIAEQHNNVVPEDVPTLLALPGIGDYTARAVAVFAYGHHHPVVDTNVRRVIARAVNGEGEAGPPSSTRDLAAMEQLLPDDRAASPLTNAAVMELGAIVCTAKKPLCEQCPVRELCAWRAAGYPAYEGKRQVVQKKFEGSDRQVRGLILAELRASDVPVTADEITQVWADAEQRERALAGLLKDGLAVAEDSGYVLP